MTTFSNKVDIGLGANTQATVLLVSQDGTANTAANPAIVPAGKFWVIKAASVTQSDATARAVAIQVVDASDNVVLNLAGDTVSTGITGIVTRFSGKVVIPAGFKLRGLTTGISASTPALQFAGFEINNNLPFSQFAFD